MANVYRIQCTAAQTLTLHPNCFPIITILILYIFFHRAIFVCLWTPPAECVQSTWNSGLLRGITQSVIWWQMEGKSMRPRRASHKFHSLATTMHLIIALLYVHLHTCIPWILARALSPMPVYIHDPTFCLRFIVIQICSCYSMDQMHNCCHWKHNHQKHHHGRAVGEAQSWEPCQNFKLAQKPTKDWLVC